MSKKADRHRLWVLHRLAVLMSRDGLEEASLEDIHRTGQYSSWLFSTRVKELLDDKLVMRLERKLDSGLIAHHYSLTTAGRVAAAALTVTDRAELDEHFDFTEPRLTVLTTLLEQREDPGGVAGKELGGKSARADAKTLSWAGYVEMVTENVPGKGNYYRITDGGVELLRCGRREVAEALAAEKIANRARSDAQNKARKKARREARRPAPLQPLEKLELFGELVAELADVQLSPGEVIVRIELDGERYPVRVGHDTFSRWEGFVLHRELRAMGLTADGEVRLQVEPGWCATVMKHWVTVAGPAVSQATLQRAINTANLGGRPQWHRASVDAHSELSWPMSPPMQETFKGWGLRVQTLIRRGQRRDY